MGKTIKKSKQKINMKIPKVKTIRYTPSETLQLFNIKISDISKNIRRFLRINKIQATEKGNGIVLSWDPYWVDCKYSPTEDKNVHLFALFAFDRTDFVEMELNATSSKLSLQTTTSKFRREVN